MTDTVAVTPETFTAQEPASVPDRMVTYPLRVGGFLAAECPTWCTTDHSDDIERGIAPVDLLHQGDKVHLGYGIDGLKQSILEARIQQFPFDDDQPAPYVEFVPEGSTAVALYCHSRLELDEQIRLVRAHLNSLIELGDRLAEAQAVDHATQSRNYARPWELLDRTDLQSLPIAYLLKVFGVTVAEVEDTGRKAVLALYGEPGSMELRVYPDVPQLLREDETRRALLGWYDAKSAAGRD
ncbi:hypothetical protein HEP84_25655 [Streptomyces sp. RLB1-33]|nr:hypothetical protein [Streptomyces sp. RLB1-33]QIY72028.1 hypothetical protein HEP84_25655 [Streptomyces sp. RLB1-33]